MHKPEQSLQNLLYETLDTTENQTSQKLNVPLKENSH